MARTIANIRQGLIDALVSNAAAIGITITPTRWSKYDYKQLILNSVATGQGIEEQLWDAYKLDIQTIAASAPPETDLWLQNQLLNNFQFNSAVPQLVGIFPPNFSPSFPIPNSSYKIIKYCSVRPATYGATLCKVAAQVNGLPADIDTTYGAGTLDTVRAFLKAITNDGITKVVTSGFADRLYMQLDVYFNGLYAAIIQPNVIAAINTFLTSLPYNGTLIWSDLEIAIKSVPGVTDCIPINVSCRDYNTAFPGGIPLTTNKTTNNRLYDSVAGYIIPEDTNGNTLTDPRPLTPTLNNLNLIPA